MKNVIAVAFVALCLAATISAQTNPPSTCKADSDCPTVMNQVMCCATFKAGDTTFTMCQPKSVVDTLGKDFPYGTQKGTLTCGTSAAATLLIKFIVGLSIMTSLLV